MSWSRVIWDGLLFVRRRWQTWPFATACEVVEVLALMSELRIYGDWSSGEEVVALDSVRFVASHDTGKLN